MPLSSNHPVTLILFMGQSNMAGRGVTCERWPQTAPALEEGIAWEYRAVSAPGQLFPLAEPFGRDENRAGGINDVTRDGHPMKSGSLVSAFCRAWYRRTGEVIVGVSASKGGSSLAEWLPGASAGYLEDTLRRVRGAEAYLSAQGIPIARRLVLFCQGETDGDLGTAPEDYIAQFRQLWSVLSRVMPEMVIIQTGRCNLPSAYHRYDAIAEAQEELCRTVPGVRMASRLLPTFLDQGLMKDAFHYYQHAYNLVGEDAAERIAGPLSQLR